jgi:hypothetical protein
MIGGGREGGIWAQSFGLSLICHGAAVAYFLFPLLDFIRLGTDVPEPMAVTLSVMEISPDVIDPAPDDPVTLPPEEVVVEPEVQPEVLAAVEPETELTLPEPEAIDPLAGLEAETIAAVDPTSLSPIRPEEGDGGGSLAPVGMAAVQAVVPVDGGASIVPDALPPTEFTPETVAAVQSLPAVAPPPQAAADPDAAEGPPGAVDEFILRIRGQLSLPCLVATPRRDPAGDVALEFMAANEADILTFSRDLLADVATPPPQRNVLVDPRQCSALNFVREGARYPTFPLAIAVQAEVVTSGERLVGALQGARGQYVSMIVIDDNGVVQDLSAYLSFSGDTVNFDIPMSRFGPARDTQQLLMAMATPGRPVALDTHNGVLATEFFPALRATVDRNTPLAMIPFRLQ